MPKICKFLHNFIHFNKTGAPNKKSSIPHTKMPNKIANRNKFVQHFLFNLKRCKSNSGAAMQNRREIGIEHKLPLAILIVPEY